jgi:hypothetical protein
MYSKQDKMEKRWRLNQRRAAFIVQMASSRVIELPQGELLIKESADLADSETGATLWDAGLALSHALALANEKGGRGWQITIHDA